MDERELIEWFRKSRGGPKAEGVLVDSGDDCAYVKVGGGAALFKVDSVIDGVHFRLGRATPEQAGHKAIARALSDIAAMGGRPTFAVVALALPQRGSERLARRVFRGMDRTARRHKVRVVGGDVARHRGKLSISVSLLGEMKGVRPVLRAGARPGDRLFVTGPLGGSIRGRHLTFEPRLKEGRSFARRRGVHAMIDISDGLVRDLDHICRASGVGADLEDIPVARGASLNGALYDGEDYELLVAAAGKLPAIEIGRISRSTGIRLQGRRLKVRGYDHLRQR